MRCLGTQCIIIADVSIFEGYDPSIFKVKFLSGRNIYPEGNILRVYSLKLRGGIPQ